jgi:hypothetical protein
MATVVVAVLALAGTVMWLLLLLLLLPNVELISSSRLSLYLYCTVSPSVSTLLDSSRMDINIFHFLLAVVCLIIRIFR